MRRREPPEGWQPGYNCADPPANECWCYADCMFDSSRWRIAGIDESAGTVHLYRDLSGTGRSARTVAIDRVSGVDWHESRNCHHEHLAAVVSQLQHQTTRDQGATT